MCIKNCGFLGEKSRMHRSKTIDRSAAMWYNEDAEEISSIPESRKDLHTFRIGEIKL